MAILLISTTAYVGIADVASQKEEIRLQNIKGKYKFSPEFEKLQLYMWECIQYFCPFVTEIYKET